MDPIVVLCDVSKAAEGKVVRTIVNSYQAIVSSTVNQATIVNWLLARQQGIPSQSPFATSHQPLATSNCLTMDFSDQNLLIIYLTAFLSLLGVAAFFILKQILQTRKIENVMTRLEKKLRTERGTVQEYYELGSIYLDKKMFVQSIAILKKAIKADGIDQSEMAPVYNALGYAYFGQEQYDVSIRQYKEAIKLEPAYVTAMNNLGHAYEQKKLTSQALDIYEQALKLEPTNDTAKRRSESLRRRLVVSSK